MAVLVLTALLLMLLVTLLTILFRLDYQTIVRFVICGTNVRQHNYNKIIYVSSSYDHYLFILCLHFHD